jgi:cytochrome c-type protein NapB
MKRTTILLLAALTLVLAAPLRAQDLATMRGAGVPDADKAPVEKVYPNNSPGTLKPIPRTFNGQPPLVPHAVSRYEITLTENPCWDCHVSNDLNGKPMPKIGDSHLVPGVVKPGEDPKLNLARWQCDSCHVPQADAKPLVENTFKGSPAAR